MGKLTSIERAERSLATRTSRRSFIGRVGRGVVALAGGGLVATSIAPERAQAYHICGHTYTTGSCPHPYSPLSRTDRYGYPMHPQYGYPVDDAGEKAKGFALGAVLAAEWIATRRGVHPFSAVLDDLLAASPPSS